MLALEGIRVVELGTRGPASFCGGMLGDLGADVIRVEVSDDAPLAARRALTGRQHEHARQTANRNKRSIAIDLTTPGGHEVMRALVQWADVVLDEFLPGALEAVSLGYDDLRRLNPGVVHCSITAYGHDGPYRQLPGDDITAQALGGYLVMAGNSLGNIGNEVQDPPPLPSILVAEHKAATHGAIAVLAALWHRRSSGAGQFIDISMLDGVVSQRAVRTMGGGGGRELRPSGGLHETKDGKYVALAAGEPWTWANLVSTLGRPDYGDIAAVHADRDLAREVIAFLASAFKTKTRDEWTAIFDGIDTEVAPVYTPEEVDGDPQMQLRHQQIEVQTVDGRRMMQYGIPMHFSETPGAVRRPAPRPGQDTEDVLRQFGVAPAP